jgi:hypothetical protein
MAAARSSWRKPGWVSVMGRLVSVNVGLSRRESVAAARGLEEREKAGSRYWMIEP